MQWWVQQCGVPLSSWTQNFPIVTENSWFRVSDLQCISSTTPEERQAKLATVVYRNIRLDWTLCSVALPSSYHLPSLSIRHLFPSPSPFLSFFSPFLPALSFWIQIWGLWESYKLPQQVPASPSEKWRTFGLKRRIRQQQLWLTFTAVNYQNCCWKISSYLAGTRSQLPHFRWACLFQTTKSSWTKVWLITTSDCIGPHQTTVWHHCKESWIHLTKCGSYALWQDVTCRPMF